MLGLLLSLAAFSSASAQMLDANCTVGGFYAPNAVACSNVYSDAACGTLYLNNSAVVAGGNGTRPSPCFNGTNGPSEDLKSMAIATCPKTCGYCCQTPAYSCNNSPYPRIQCNQVTSRMCQDASWRAIIAQDCPNVCGFCLLGGCIDSAPDCASQPTICVTKGLESFVASNCQRTCGLCSSSSTSSSSGSSSCGNNNANCASWVKNGFCTSSFYTQQEKMAYCGTSCGLCSGK